MTRSLVTRLAPLALLIALCAAPAQAQTCPDADYTLTTQAQVDAFPNTCSEIMGGLLIGRVSGSDITDISRLSGLTSVGAGLNIIGNNGLASLGALSGVASDLASLNVTGNDALTSLSGLDGIPSVGSFLYIRGNDALTSLAGLSGVTTIDGDLSVNGNAALTTVDGLSNLESVGGYLLATFNASLTSLQGFAGVTSVGGALDIQSNDVLTSLDGLSGFTAVGGYLLIAGNPVLESLGTLSGVTSVGETVSISQNAMLESLDGLDGITSIGGDLSIFESPALVSLGALSGLTALGGGLAVSNNAVLASLDGLGGLSAVEGSLTLSTNAALASVAGLDGLTSVGGNLGISGNPALASLVGLDGITSVGATLLVHSNDMLTSLGGLDGITSVGGNLSIRSNAALATVAGLDGVTSVGGTLSITQSPALASLDGLGGLATIGSTLLISGNPVLESIGGLGGLSSIGDDLSIRFNDALASLDGLDGLTFVGDDLRVDNNPMLAECAVGLAGLISGSPPAFTPRVAGTVTVTGNAGGGACTSPEDVLAAYVPPSVTRHVDQSVAVSGDGSSWGDAFKTLTEALAVAGEGDVIRVAEGTYTPSATGDRTASFVVPGGVHVLGGYASGGTSRDRQPNDGVTDTILSGDLLGDDGPDFENNAENSYHVVRMDGGAGPITADPADANYTLLEGLTIRGGNVDVGGGGFETTSGGGLYGTNISPALTHVSFVSNAATFGGGGAFVQSGSPVFTNVTFSGNSAPRGGGVYVLSTDAVFTNVIFSSNSASVESGGAYVRDDTGTHSVSFTNAVFSNNSGGGLTARGVNSNTVVQNSILWGNTPFQVFISDSPVVSLDHAIVEGGCPVGSRVFCTDVLDEDPLFTDAADLTLRAGSPAIDVGDAALLPADTYDLDADGDTTEPVSLDLALAPRVQGLGLDLGAFDRVSPATLTGTDGWRMLSAPSTTESVGGLLSTVWTQGFPGADVETGAPNVFLYDESVAGDEQQGYAAPASAADLLPAGAGVFVYVYADDDPGTPGIQGGFPKPLTADGTEATAPFDFALGYTDSGSAPNDGWNLLGNPFAAGLTLDALGRTDVSGASYVWDPALGRYLTRTSGAGDLGAVLGSFQGFWAQALAPGAGLAAPPAARGNDEILIGRGAAPVALRVHVAPAEDSDPAAGDAAWLVFADGGTDGLDALDAYELGALGPRPAALYAVADGLALDVSVLSVDGGVVPLALDVAESGDYEMTWTGDDLPDGPLTLTDALTGAVTDLRTASSYAFWADGTPTGAARTADRAALAAPRPQRLGTDGVATSARFTIHAGGNATASDAAPTATALGAPRPNPSAGGARLTLSLAQTGPVRAEVYDALGRRVAVLADGPLGAGRHDLRVAAGTLAPGLYIVRVATADGVLDQRLTVVR